MRSKAWRRLPVRVPAVFRFPVLLCFVLVAAGCTTPAAEDGPASDAAEGATTSQGSSSPSEVLTVPALSAPASQARSLDPRAVTFTWLPATSSAGIATYELILGGTSRSECRSTHTQCTVRNLAPGTQYEWTVTARSLTGKIATSVARSFTTNARPDVVGALAETNGLEQVPLQVRLGWGPARDADGDALTYQVRLAPAGGRESSICSGNILSCDVPTRLTAGTRYTMTLVATDAIGLEASTTATFTTRRPIVLVHGYMGDSTTWNGMLQALVAADYPVLDFDPTRAGVQAMAYDSIMDGGIPRVATAEVAPRINAALIAAGYSSDAPIDVVAHSMGGLVTRWLAEQAGASVNVRDYSISTPTKWGTQVRNLVTLATPHYGSNWSFCFSDVCEDMSPDSPFLEYLGYEAAGAQTRYFAAGGGEDAVVDWRSAQLSGADWTYIEDACHSDSDCRIIGHPDALDLVERALEMRRA